MSAVQHYVINVITLINATYPVYEYPKVAVVTGANKGIGYEIVKGLCEASYGIIHLTSRNETYGKEAVKSLKKLGYNPLYHQLDVTDLDSIQHLRDFIYDTVRGIDLLINNAAIANFYDTVTPYDQQVENVMNVNYFGVLQVSNSLFPLLRPNARVIHISSKVGVLSRITSKTLRDKLASPTLTIEQLNDLMNQYKQSAKQNKHAQEGWPSNHDSPYVVSKIGVSALTFIQQRNIDADPEGRNVSVNCVHPGYVATDLTNNHGDVSAKEGAKAPLYLALKNHNHRGKFLDNDLSLIDWYNY